MDPLYITFQNDMFIVFYSEIVTMILLKNG